MNDNAMQTAIRVTLLLIIHTACFSQHAFNEEICNKLVEIDTTAYKTSQIKSDPILNTNRFVKINGKLTITTKDSVYTFVDIKLRVGPSIPQYEEDYASLFRVIGDDVKRNWVWIEEQQLNTAKYYLINTKTSCIDTLIGSPRIFNHRIVCLEPEYTDSPTRVEIYKIRNNKILLERNFSLNPCDKICCVRILYLKGKTLYLGANDYKDWKAWKVKVFD
ncbi:MAG: hypothetical protein U0289_12275 [Cyclobacteriaceae bacterium]|jgi:uncharacterized protein with WD repeat